MSLPKKPVNISLIGMHLEKLAKVGGQGSHLPTHSGQPASMSIASSAATSSAAAIASLSAHDAESTEAFQTPIATRDVATVVADAAKVSFAASRSDMASVPSPAAIMPLASSPGRAS